MAQGQCSQYTREEDTDDVDKLFNEVFNNNLLNVSP